MDESPAGPSGRPGPGDRGADQLFEVRITGLVADDVLGRLDDVEVTTRELRTTLRARLRDQAELHGLLARLRTYGLEVVEVRRLASGRDDGPRVEEPS
ncbi:hypothetical protein [Aeromicrobium massiliense]|uniref:hypothetical protein n=1 Tax=Aeromicrobium massiliense TaxID=1464554 RepID=UPI0003090ED5|nr:hypothetical protein [Aeromicrobium massiliense]